MKIHLDELELMAAAQQAARGEQDDARVRLHLAACPECRATVGEMAALHSRMSEALETASEQPDAFWLRQQAAIRTRIASAQTEPARASRGFLLAMATAGLAAVLLAGGVAWNVIHNANPVAHHVNPPVVQPVHSGSGQGDADSDHEMLVAIEQELDSGAPDALQPAMGLYTEVSKAHATTGSKPKRTPKQ